jgi:DNA-binding NarL/FixJ family response regulator
MEQARQLRQRARQIEQPRSLLSTKELAVIFLLSHGMDFRKIAGTLFVSPETVDSRINQVRKKLGAKNRTHAVAIALRLGLID